ASEIGVRREHDETARVMDGALGDVPRFDAFSFGDVVDELRIPRFAEADSLLKARRRDGRLVRPVRGAAHREPVNAFDDVRAFNAEPRHARTRAETIDLLGEREPA